MSNLEAFKQPPVNRRSEVVYFVRAKTLGVIKVGRAASLKLRLGCLQTGSPDKLELMGVIRHPDALELERHLHSVFAKDRLHGEWFKPSDALLAYIAAHAEQPLDAEQQERIRRGEKQIAKARAKVEGSPKAPKGESRQARMERYKLARGLAA